MLAAASGACSYSCCCPITQHTSQWQCSGRRPLSRHGMIASRPLLLVVVAQSTCRFACTGFRFSTAVSKRLERFLSYLAGHKRPAFSTCKLSIVPIRSAYRFRPFARGLLSTYLAIQAAGRRAPSSVVRTPFSNASSNPHEIAQAKAHVRSHHTLQISDQSDEPLWNGSRRLYLVQHSCAFLLFLKWIFIHRNTENIITHSGFANQCVFCYFSMDIETVQFSPFQHQQHHNYSQKCAITNSK